MSLTIGPWPPLASHFAAFALGALTVHLLSGPGRPLFQLPKDSVSWSLSSARFANRSASGSMRGKGVLIGRQLTAEQRCLLSDKPLLLIATEPTVVLSTPIKTGPEIAAEIHAHDLSGLTLVGSSARLPLCASAPKITYGTGG